GEADRRSTQTYTREPEREAAITDEVRGRHAAGPAGHGRARRLRRANRPPARARNAAWHPSGPPRTNRHDPAGATGAGGAREHRCGAALRVALPRDRSRVGPGRGARARARALAEPPRPHARPPRGTVPSGGGAPGRRPALRRARPTVVPRE